MTADQIFLFCLLIVVLGLLIWGRVRYDVVAFGALIVAYVGGVIPKEEVFTGFGHPATVIIALVLIISYEIVASDHHTLQLPAEIEHTYRQREPASQHTAKLGGVRL